MTDDTPPHYPDMRTATVEEITEVFARGVRAALRAHKSAGHAIVVWDRDTDRIIVLRPNQIQVPDEPPSGAPSTHRPTLISENGPDHSS